MSTLSCSVPAPHHDLVLLPQVPGNAKAELRQEIFLDLLDVLRFDPPDSRRHGKAEMLRQALERFDMLCAKYERVAQAFIDYLRIQWRPKLGMVPTPYNIV
jgi:hypothetical protein